MYLEKLSLLHFKNYEEADITFSPHINVFTGNNGSGKTNLVDAIHYLCLTKSAFSKQDAYSVKHNADFFIISGKISKGSRSNKIICSYKTGQKKIIQSDKTPYEKISEHIGKFPLVLITPYDTDVIREGSEERRRFMDGILAQSDKKYLENLITYNHLLKQRNALLKQFHESGKKDLDLLEIFDHNLLAKGQEVYKGRAAFIDDFLPVFLEKYSFISSKKEDVSIVYDSKVGDANFEEKFRKNIERDLYLQRTTMGIHKDDLLFNLNEKALKSFGSQGQQKSFVISLKLAQYEFLKQKTSVKPLLLLDDIFEKLDEERIMRLMELISGDYFGQIFITDARIEKTDKYFRNISEEIAIFRITKGKIEKL